MITEYKIFENINKFNNYKHLLRNTVNFINSEYYMNIFEIYLRSDNVFVIHNNNNDIIFKISVNDNLSIFYKNIKIFYSVSIYDIRKFLIEKQSLYNIFKLHDIDDYYMYDNLTDSQFIKQYELYENKYFVNNLIKKLYTKDIIKEYQYLLDAKNFDLI